MTTRIRKTLTIEQELVTAAQRLVESEKRTLSSVVELSLAAYLKKRKLIA